MNPASASPPPGSIPPAVPSSTGSTFTSKVPAGTPIRDPKLSDFQKETLVGNIFTRQKGGEYYSINAEIAGEKVTISVLVPTKELRALKNEGALEDHVLRTAAKVAAIWEATREQHGANVTQISFGSNDTTNFKVYDGLTKLASTSVRKLTGSDDVVPEEVNSVRRAEGESSAKERLVEIMGKQMSVTDAVNYLGRIAITGPIIPVPIVRAGLDNPVTRDIPKDTRDTPKDNRQEIPS